MYENVFSPFNYLNNKLKQKIILPWDTNVTDSYKDLNMKHDDIGIFFFFLIFPSISPCSNIKCLY